MNKTIITLLLITSTLQASVPDRDQPKISITTNLASLQANVEKAELALNTFNMQYKGQSSPEIELQQTCLANDLKLRQSYQILMTNKLLKTSSQAILNDSHQ